MVLVVKTPKESHPQRGLPRKRSRLYSKDVEISTHISLDNLVTPRDATGGLIKENTALLSKEVTYVDYGCQEVVMNKKETPRKILSRDELSRKKEEKIHQPKPLSSDNDLKSPPVKSTSHNKPKTLPNKVLKLKYGELFGRLNLFKKVFRDTYHYIAFVMLSVSLLPVSHGQHLLIETTQNLSAQKHCWHWFQQTNDCPRHEREFKDLTAHCCGHMQRTFIHCQAWTFDNGTDYVFPACFSTRTVMNGTTMRLMVTESKDAKLEVEPCSDGHFETDNRPSYWIATPECSKHTYCNPLKGMYVLCSGHASADNQCGCLPGYKSLGINCHHGFDPHDMCLCEKSLCKNGETRIFSNVSLGFCGSVEIPYQNDTCVLQSSANGSEQEKTIVSNTTVTFWSPADENTEGSQKDVNTGGPQKNSVQISPSLWLFFGLVVIICVCSFIHFLFWLRCFSAPSYCSDPKLLGTSDSDSQLSVDLENQNLGLDMEDSASMSEENSS